MKQTLLAILNIKEKKISVGFPQLLTHGLPLQFIGHFH